MGAGCFGGGRRYERFGRIGTIDTDFDLGHGGEVRFMLNLRHLVHLKSACHLKSDCLESVLIFDLAISGLFSTNYALLCALVVPL